MSCVGCAYYSELKEPRVQRHKEGFVYTVRGYCFYGDYWGYNFGLAVLTPETSCIRFEREEKKR